MLGVLFWDDFQASFVSTLGMGFLFIITYLVGISIAKKDVLPMHKFAHNLQSLGYWVMDFYGQVSESFCR